MTLSYWYVCDVNPVPWRVGPLGIARGASGKMRPYAGRDQEVFTYQQAIKSELEKQKPVMLDGELSLTIFFWRNIATFESASGRKSKNQDADTTNMFKATEDACQNILFANDRNNVVTRGFTIAQGPEVTGKVVICLEKFLPGDTETLLKLLPDSIYKEVYGRPTDGTQLLLALGQPNTTLTADDPKYANAPDDF